MDSKQMRKKYDQNMDDVEETRNERKKIDFFFWFLKFLIKIFLNCQWILTLFKMKEKKPNWLRKSKKTKTKMKKNSSKTKIECEEKKPDSYHFPDDYSMDFTHQTHTIFSIFFH